MFPILIDTLIEELETKCVVTYDLGEHSDRKKKRKENNKIQ
jgi:hypothetical protein